MENWIQIIELDGYMFIFICLFSRRVLKFFDALLGDGIYMSGPALTLLTGVGEFWNIWVESKPLARLV